MEGLPIVRRFLSCLVFIGAAAGTAQIPTNTHPAADPSSPTLDRRIELLIRSQFAVRPDYDMTLGTRTPSDTAGYENLPITFSHKGKQPKMAARSNALKNSVPATTRPWRLM
jgi:hypothetical protein